MISHPTFTPWRNVCTMKRVSWWWVGVQSLATCCKPNTGGCVDQLDFPKYFDCSFNRELFQVLILHVQHQFVALLVYYRRKGSARLPLDCFRSSLDWSPRLPIKSWHPPSALWSTCCDKLNGYSRGELCSLLDSWRHPLLRHEYPNPWAMPEREKHYIAMLMLFVHVSECVSSRRVVFLVYVSRISSFPIKTWEPVQVSRIYKLMKVQMPSKNISLWVQFWWMWA